MPTLPLDLIELEDLVNNLASLIRAESSIRECRDRPKPVEASRVPIKVPVANGASSLPASSTTFPSGGCQKLPHSTSTESGKSSQVSVRAFDERQGRNQRFQSVSCAAIGSVITSAPGRAEGSFTLRWHSCHLEFILVFVRRNSAGGAAEWEELPGAGCDGGGGQIRS